MSMLDGMNVFDGADDWIDAFELLYAEAFDRLDTMVDDVVELNEATLRYVLQLARGSGDMTLEVLRTSLGALSSSEE